MAKASSASPSSADFRAGFQRFPDDIAWKASRRWRSAHRYIPLTASWIMACCAIAVLATVVSLFSVISRPTPMLFLSYPDGTIRCAPAALDPATGRPLPRTSQEAAVCRQLDFKYGVLVQEAGQ